ncbi:MAG: LacI family DNA-binding transcriptional regulator [Marinosulfonomonas sp.]
MKTKLTDIAQAAGVSPATVDRVLNNRKGVKESTRLQVQAAARRLGYFGEPDPVDPADFPPVRMHFLLPAGTNTFIREFGQQIRDQVAALPGVSVTVETFEGFEPSTLASRLDQLQGQTDAVALVALDHPLVREAIRGLVQSGVHTVTMISDIRNVPRKAYVGIDNAQAGRLAAYILGRFQGKKDACKVAFFAGSLAYRGHQEREMGFRQVLQEDFRNFELVELREVQENREKAYAATIALLDRQPDLAAIYNADGATKGIVRALKEKGRDQDIVLIAHEATADNKALLLDGSLDAAIDQNPRVEIRETLQTLIHAARGTEHKMVPPRLHIIFRENLPID